MRPVFLGVVLAGSAACAARDHPLPDATALTVADRALSRAVFERGLEAWVAAFAEDGVMLTQDGVVGPGPPIIRAHMAPAFSDTAFRLRWQPSLARVAQSEDVGYTLGTYQGRRGDGPGATRALGGSYLTVWRKGRDGTWRVALMTLLDSGSPPATP